MKILVYGAGVLGCELAHEMIKSGNDVTLLARGEWKKTLEDDGLVVRHWAQLHTTVDHPPIIGTLRPEDEYDLIFVVMQFSQLPAVLPILAANQSRFVVLVGNNPCAEEALHTLTDCARPKEVAFGFQGTAGRREKSRVVSIHTSKVGMTVGALCGELSPAFRALLEKAAGDAYRLTWEKHMDAWLKCHLAFILPICYVCYALDGHLPRVHKAELHRIIHAAIEANQALKTLGYPIRPDGEEEYFTVHAKKCYRMLWIMAKTPIGRLVASDHAMRAKAEMCTLDAVFEVLRQKAHLSMPAWDTLRNDSGCSDQKR